MITISTTAHITAGHSYVQLEGIPEGMYEVIIVLQPRSNGHGKKARKAGFSKATFVMSADFNEPLQDFKDYM